MNKTNDLFRMSTWLLFAAALYGSALICTQPQIQTALWKMGHITSGAYLGYWVDRHLFGMLYADATQGRIMARALIVAAAVMGMASGL